MMKRFASFIHTSRYLVLHGCAVIFIAIPFQVRAENVSDYEVRIDVTDVGAGHEQLHAHARDHDHADDEDELYGACPQENEVIDFEPFEAVNGRCLPDTSAGRGRNSRRDLSICQCLEQNPESLQGLSYKSIRERDPQGDLNFQTQTAMNRNIDRLNGLLNAEQRAMQFQASSLPASDRSNRFLIGAFTNRFDFDLKSREAELQTRALAGFNSSSVAGAPNSVPMTRIVIPDRPDGDLLAPPADFKELRYCIPTRTFMTAQQMPSDPLFFQDLADLPADYTENRDAWNYHRLKINFVKMSRSSETLSQALRNPEAKKLYLRIQFLERNPLYRNLFSSVTPGSDVQKQALLNMIRSAYGPGVRPEQMYDNFQKLRKDSGAFFTSSDDVINMTQNGAVQNFEALLREVPTRVNKISNRYSPRSLWADSVSRNGVPHDSRNPDIPDPNRTNLGVYGEYCPRLQWASRQNQFLVLKEMEERLASTYNPTEDPASEYSQLTLDLCNNEDRTGPGGTTRWPQYLLDTCPTGNSNPLCAPEKREQLLAKFINDFPEGKPSRDSLNHIMPFLEQQDLIPEPERRVAQAAADEGLNRRFLSTTQARQNRAAAHRDFRSSGGEMPSPQVSRSVSRVPASSAASTQQTQTTQQNLNQQNSNSSAAQVPFALTETGNVSAAPGSQTTVTASPEVVRTEISRTDTEMQSLREQIAGLTRDLQSESSKPQAQKDDSEIRELTRRMDSLTSRLEQVSAENARLKQTRDESSRSRRKSASSEEIDEEDSPSLSSQTVSSQQVPSSQQKPEQSSSGALSGGAGALPSGGASLGRSTSGSRRSAGSINGALLANQRNGSGQVNSEGQAIIVSNTNAAEYQQLRSQSGNAISETVPVEEFQRIADGDTSLITQRFADSLPTRTGDKRLYEVRSEQSRNTKVEVIVTKTDNGYSIAFGQDRSPASEKAVSRENTLENLNQRIQESQ